MKIFTIIIFCLLPLLSYSQPNCNVYLYKGDTALYKACKFAEENGRGYYQFDRRMHAVYDSALAICDRFAYAYRVKSVAYLKSGDFLTWKKLIDQAVKYEPELHMGYRGWCRYQFFRDYDGAIKDIENLEKLIAYDIGYSANGNYHLMIAKALCYMELDEKQKAIDIIEKQLAKEDYEAGLFDYYQLGVCYFQMGNDEKALFYLLKQKDQKVLAETEYYLAKIYKSQGKMEEYKSHKSNALEYYQKGHILFDDYSHHTNKVYYADLKNDLN